MKASVVFASVVALGFFSLLPVIIYVNDFGGVRAFFRTDHHLLASAAVGDAPPERREDRRHEGRDRGQRAGPEIDLGLGLHASRLDGAALVYNGPDTNVPDLLIGRPDLAERAIALIAGRN